MVVSMETAAGTLAKKRLFLGITNVGFWVAVSVVGLWRLAPADTPRLELFDLCFGAACLLGVQSLFDWVGGDLWMPASESGYGSFPARWGRAFGVHTGLLVAIAILLLWSHRWFGNFCPGVALCSFGLMWKRLSVLKLLTGVSVRPCSVGGASGWSVDSKDPSFTGGIYGLGRWAVLVLPGVWEKRLEKAALDVVLRRRLWEILEGIPGRTFVVLTGWNLFGCWIGSSLFDLHTRHPVNALALHGFWMTLWAFVGLLLLPGASRSSVHASDCAVAAEGCDVTGWIQAFPLLVGEDGSPNRLVQLVFYPIPSAAERLRGLETRRALPVFGQVARTNLYLSLATLTLLGRCVHCNVGRPELWVFAPSD
jgi:hypothetical protein